MSRFNRKIRQSFRLKRRRGLKSLTRFRRKRVTLKKRVRKLERQIEKKTRDDFLDYNFVGITSGDSQDALTQIPQGNTTTNREGNKVFGVSLQIKGLMLNLDVNPATLRIMVVKDMNQNFNVAAELDEIVATSPSIITGLRLQDEFSRFKILHDHLYHFGAAGQPGSRKNLNLFYKLNQTFHYKGAFATDADTGNGMISIYMVSSILDKIQFEGASRFRYTDA